MACPIANALKILPVGTFCDSVEAFERNSSKLLQVGTFDGAIYVSFDRLAWEALLLTLALLIRDNKQWNIIKRL